MLKYHITIQGVHRMALEQQLPPQQKRLYYPQITHRDKLYFSLLSCSDFGILSCPTAAVSEKTRRAPTHLETIPHNLESRKNENILDLDPGTSSLHGLLASAEQPSQSERTRVINHVRAL